MTITSLEAEETINTQQPEIIGRGPIGKELQITIESSQAYTDTITVDENGDWDWTPPEDLEPGDHTITITYQDDEGLLQTLSQTFTVLAAGSSQLPSFSATPSGEASPSSTPTPTLSPSPTPTLSARTALPSTEGGVPTSGYLTPTFLVFIMGLVLISFGTLSHSLFKKF